MILITKTAQIYQRTATAEYLRHIDWTLVGHVGIRQIKQAVSWVMLKKTSGE